MKVGVLGSGVVGQRLAVGFAQKGHDVKIGTRDLGKEELRKLVKESGGKVSIGSFGEASAHGELLVLCCLGSVVDEVVDAAGPKHFEEKVLIDVTNPLDFSRGMPPGLLFGTTDSLGERIQRRLPRTKVVKCFNTVGNPTMTHPQMTEGTPTMMYAGNDEKAKAKVASILKEFGWEDTLDVGGIDGARWLEAIVPLWVRVAQKTNTWTPAFRVLRR